MKSDKRQQIVNAATSLFQRTHDVKKVSLEDIARLAGVSPATIYNQFGNREALLYEVSKALVSRSLERNRALIRSDLPFDQKIIGVMRGKLDLAAQANDEVIGAILSQDATVAPFIEQIYQQEIRPLWKEMLADGKRQGYIDPDLDDEALLIYVDVLKDGFAARPELAQNVTENMELLKQMTHIMFYGFLKKEINLFAKEA